MYLKEILKCEGPVLRGRKKVHTTASSSLSREVLVRTPNEEGGLKLGITCFKLAGYHGKSYLLILFQFTGNVMYILQKPYFWRYG